MAVALAGVLAIAGCGGDDGDDEASVTQTVTETVAAQTETAAPVETTPVETTEAETPTATGKATPAGTTLKVGETATIDYVDSGNSKKKSLIDVTPGAIEKGTLDDFKNIDLDPAQKKSTPYYVKLTVKNVGKGDLSGTEPGSYINGVDDRGQDQNEIIFFGDFDRCPDADPKSLKPGESYETCLTYLVPGGGSIEGFHWIFFDEKSGKSDIVWE